MRVAHGGEVDHGGNAGEVLHQDARGAEGIGTNDGHRNLPFGRELNQSGRAHAKVARNPKHVVNTPRKLAKIIFFISSATTWRNATE
jgi:hypothetical protein